MAPPTSNAPERDETPEKWLSVAAAARRLELSERTIQRRAARGELDARTVSDEQGKRLLIRFEVPTPNDRGADKLPTGADNLTTHIHAQRGEAADNSPLAADKLPTPNDTSFAGHLLEENRFLRGVIEQLQRDGAEVRAALRKALELAPKQLAAPSPVQPDERARDAPQRVQNGKVDIHGPNALKVTKTGGNGGESLSYGDIADALEALEKERSE